MRLNIALGRALNVGGRAAPSADLKGLFESLGCSEVKTVLQTGNILYAGDASDAFRPVLEAAFAARFGYAADFFLRDPADWRALICVNPFTDAAKTKPNHLLVYCLAAEPEPGAARALCDGWSGQESIAVRGRQAFVVYGAGVAGSKLTTAVLERRLGLRGTARNWNTVLKIASLTGALN